MSRDELIAYYRKKRAEAVQQILSAHVTKDAASDRPMTERKIKL